MRGSKISKQFEVWINVQPCSKDGKQGNILYINFGLFLYQCHRRCPQAAVDGDQFARLKLCLVEDKYHVNII